MSGLSPDQTVSGQAAALSEKLFEFSPDAIVVTDSSGKIMRANAQAERLFGYDRDEIVGRHVEMLMPERFRQVHPSHRKNYMARSQLRPMGIGLELFGLRKDGTEFPIDIMLSPVETPDGLTVLSVIRDVTDRKKAAEIVRASEGRFRSLFEFSPDAIIVSDATGEITDVNGQVDRFFGYQRAELIGQSIEVLVPERFRNAHPRHRERYNEQPNLRPMGIGLELYARRKDGTEFPVDIMLGPVDSPQGRLVLTVVRDLTQKKEAEEALRRSEEEKRYLEEELTTTHQFEEIVGESQELKRVLRQVETVAATDATVLVLGETGTGKELIARAIHNLSPRRDRAFVKLNCSAIPTGLLESELFGHEKGAFTGAIAQKIGRLELAHQGTFFLDEIGDLPLELQPKILRALQEKEFERVGSARTIPVNVRLLAATNRNLSKMVEDHEFRSDLYYRLKVFPIQIPSLRERQEDIPLLVKYFVAQHARRMNRNIETITPETMEVLTHWHWPGNVRELENFIERAVILTSGPVLRAPLAELQTVEGSSQEPVQETDANLEDAERHHILKILKEAKGMIGGSGGAAERLGLKRTTLHSKLKKLGIKRSDYI